MKILFLHGWTSVPGGLKPTYLKDAGHQVLNPALPDDDFDESVRIAESEYDQHKPDVIVGSSRGGAVAVNMNKTEPPDFDQSFRKPIDEGLLWKSKRK